MRRTICLAAFVAMCLTLFGQTLNVKKGNIVYQFAASQAGDMVYDNASTLTVMGATLAIGDITKMYIDDAAVSEGTVAVDYEGSAANAPGRPGGGGTMGGSILVSCDGMSSGSSYTLVNGTLSATVTATLKSSGSGGGRW